MKKNPAFAFDDEASSEDTPFEASDATDGIASSKQTPQFSELPMAKPGDARSLSEVPVAKPGDETSIEELPLAKPLSKRGGSGATLPGALVDFAVDTMADNYVRTGNFGAAANLTRRSLSRRWQVERDPAGYRFKEIVGPFDLYHPSRARPSGAPSTPPPIGDVGAAEVPEVAAARRAWDEAKTSADPDRMTRAANDLLRAVEKARAANGADAPPADTGRDPISDILDPRPPGPGADLLPEEHEHLFEQHDEVASDTDRSTGEAATGSEVLNGHDDQVGW